jgi:hypothetical protein
MDVITALVEAMMAQICSSQTVAKFCKRNFRQQIPDSRCLTDFLWIFTLVQGCQMAYFQTPNPNLEGLAMEDVGIFYVHLVHV